jgi:hypothetical protein
VHLEQHAASWSEFVVVREVGAHEGEAQRPCRLNESPASLAKHAGENDAHTRKCVRMGAKPKLRLVPQLDDPQQSRRLKQKHRDALPPYKTWSSADCIVTYAHPSPRDPL